MYNQSAYQNVISSPKFTALDMIVIQWRLRSVHYTVMSDINLKENNDYVLFWSIDNNREMTMIKQRLGNVTTFYE